MASNVAQQVKEHQELRVSPIGPRAGAPIVASGWRPRLMHVPLCTLAREAHWSPPQGLLGWLCTGRAWPLETPAPPTSKGLWRWLSHPPDLAASTASRTLLLLCTLQLAGSLTLAA